MIIATRGVGHDRRRTPDPGHRRGHHHSLYRRVAAQQVRASE